MYCEVGQNKRIFVSGNVGNSKKTDVFVITLWVGSIECTVPQVLTRHGADQVVELL